MTCANGTFYLKVYVMVFGVENTLASSIDFSKSQQRANVQGRVLRDIRSVVADPVAVRETVQALKSIKRVTTGVVKSYLCKNDNEPRINDLPSIYEKSRNYELKLSNPRVYAGKIDPPKTACKQLVSHLGDNKKIRIDPEQDIYLQAEIPHIILRDKNTGS